MVYEWWHKMVNRKQSSTFQVRSKKPFSQGHIRLLNRTGIVASYPDLDDNGNVVTVMSLITDVSELKWNEEQLHLRQRELEKSEEKYRNFAEHAPVSI